MKKQESGVNIAGLVALLNGDYENAKIAMMLGGIEAQEAQGQNTFVNSETLPIDCNFSSREVFEAMGIVYGEREQDDAIFVPVILPDGWKKVPTSHSMWSELRDEKGRKRASIFYKAAFYDRSAHISPARRFSYTYEPVGGYDDPENANPRYHSVVIDCGNVIWESEPFRPQPNSYDEMNNWLDEKDEMVQQAKRWLIQNYPDYQDVLAYQD